MIMDVTDPQAPTYLSWEKTRQDRVLLDGPLVYLTSTNRNSVSVRSVPDLNLQGLLHTVFTPGGFGFSGNHLFVAAAADGLGVFDVTYPWSITPLTTYAEGEHHLGFSRKYSFSWELIWSGNSSSFGYRVWDLSDPMVPVVRVSGGGGGFETVPYYNTLACQEDLVCFSEGDSQGPSVLALYDLAQEPPLRVNLPDFYNPRDLQLDGNIAWILTDESTLVAADISDFHNAVILSTTPLDARKLILEEDRAFAVDRYPETLIPLDLGDPFSPQVGSAILLPSKLESQMVHGGLVYVGTESSGLLIYDISDVFTENLVGQISLSTGNKGILWHNGQVLLLHETGFQIISATDPTNPQLISQVEGVIEPQPLAIWSADRLYLSESSGDLEVWDLSDLTLPWLVGSAMGAGRDLYAGVGNLVEPGGVYPLDCGELVSVADDLVSSTPSNRSRIHTAPNPFNPKTTVLFSVPEEGPVDLSVYDLRGNHLRTLVTGYRDRGDHVLQWDGKDQTGRNLSSGTYFLTLKWAAGLSSSKVTLVR